LSQQSTNLTSATSIKWGFNLWKDLLN